MNRKLFLSWLILQTLSIGLALVIRPARATTPTPALTSTYIQFRDPPPPSTPEVPFYYELPTPIPFADMPLLYFYDAAHDTDCWVTFNHMAVSCLRRPVFWPCEGKARNDY